VWPCQKKPVDRLFLPFYNGLADAEQERVIDAVLAFPA
jgi:hypothetical protein